MTTMSESDQTVPVYIKKHEFTKLKENREIWYSKPFYLCRRCKVRLYIDASQCAHNQGPLVELHLMEGPYNNERICPLQGDLKLLLVHHKVDAFRLIYKGYHVIRDGQKVISTATFPVNTPPDYFRDDSVIILVSFFRIWPEIIIGIVFLLIIFCVVVNLYDYITK